MIPIRLQLRLQRFSQPLQADKGEAARLAALGRNLVGTSWVPPDNLLLVLAYPNWGRSNYRKSRHYGYRLANR
ncbi:MAG: hypothetical protein MK171_03245 [Pirellulales bacterium]|nr:hypothetical protein [Pirellulales bacterium]